jgi:hypothetical protein
VLLRRLDDRRKVGVAQGPKEPPWQVCSSGGCVVNKHCMCFPCVILHEDNNTHIIMERSPRNRSIKRQEARHSTAASGCWRDWKATVDSTQRWNTQEQPRTIWHWSTCPWRTNHSSIGGLWSAATLHSCSAVGRKA